MIPIKVIFVVVVATCCSASPAVDEDDECFGCPETADVNDPSIIKKVHAVMQHVNTSEQLDKIMSVTKQLVTGWLYKVELTTISGKWCNLSWLEQHWISAQPQYLEFNCDPPKKIESK